MSETAKHEPTLGAARHLAKPQPADYRTSRIARCWGQDALPGDSAGGSETPDGGRLALHQLFGQADTTLPDLQADFPGYLITAEYLGLPSFCYIAKRISEGDGPYLVLTEDADEMRRVLGSRTRARGE